MMRDTIADIGGNGDYAIEHAVAPMAAKLGVSKQAMRIRVERLGLIVDGNQPAIL